VPLPERIAVFDNDGTLWAENPHVQGVFTLKQVKEVAKDHPEWTFTYPFDSALKTGLSGLPIEDILRVSLTTDGAFSQEKLKEKMGLFVTSSLHPRFQVPYVQTVYLPMLELLTYLRQHGFKTWICTGGGMEFVRSYSEKIYGIPPEQVIGSSAYCEFRGTEEDSMIARTSNLISFNVGPAKPVNIEMHIGRRPVVAVGNSDGDLQMLQYAAGRKGLSLEVLLVHDDATREFDYSVEKDLPGNEQTLPIAEKHGWTVVSMKKDFRKMFPFSK
jgi:phosphoserine phosphatase